jgi:hypothetical protein
VGLVKSTSKFCSGSTISFLIGSSDSKARTRDKLRI